MAVISNSPFNTGTAGGNVTGYTPTSGSGWTKHPSYAGDIILAPTGTVDRARANAQTASALYRDTTALGSADLTVEVFLKRHGFDTNYKIGVAARMDSSADTYYAVYHDSQNGDTRLVKSVAGTVTTLGTPHTQTFFEIGTWATGYGLRLTLSGTSLSVFENEDGAGWSAAIITATDSAISAAGSGGLLLQTALTGAPTDTSGVSFDYYTLDGTASGGGGGAARAYYAALNGLR